MNTHREGGGIAPLVYNLYSRRKGVIPHAHFVFPAEKDAPLPNK